MSGDRGPLDLGITGISDAVEIGSGGFGVVYRAVEADLGRTVAVKVLTGNLDEGARYRFERERRAMGRLSGHPNIVTVYRSGYTASGNAYLVMEFLDRGSLADRLQASGALEWQEALKFGVQLSGALETSHRAGVLHRDIKPGNILLSRLGNAKLCDFGIARLQGAPETRSSVVTASLAHAPPDIVSGRRPDARSDVYSLASTLFELVAATPPFVHPTDDSMVPILARITQDPVPRLPEDKLPWPAFSAIEAAMAKSPDDRPASASAFGELLVAAQIELGLPPTPIPIDDVPPDAFPDSSPPDIPFPETSPKRLPPPVAGSPQGITAPSPSPASSGETPAAAPTRISGPYHAEGWAPPQPPDAEPGPGATEGWAPPRPPQEERAPGGTEGWNRPGERRAERPRWLVPVAVLAAVLIAAAGIVAAAAMGGDGTQPDDTTAGEEPGGDPGSTAPTSGSTSTSADEGNDLELQPGETAPGQGGDDYETYIRITDASGTIGLTVPLEWSDVSTGPGRNGAPFLAASPQLDGGFYDAYVAPGVSVEVRTSAADDLDAVLDNQTNPECSPVDRRTISAPLRGRLELLADCAGTETQLVHAVYVDRLRDVTVLMRIQMLSDRDRQAAMTLGDSLTID